jgi:hypothetical protein
MRIDELRLVKELTQAIRDTSDPDTIKAAAEEHRLQLSLTAEEQAKREEYIKIKADAEQSKAESLELQKSVTVQLQKAREEHDNYIKAETEKWAPQQAALAEAQKAHRESIAQVNAKEIANSQKEQALQNKEKALIEAENAFALKSSTTAQKLANQREENEKVSKLNIERDKILTQREEALRRFVSVNLQ